jgi:hypothetical protein
MGLHGLLQVQFYFYKIRLVFSDMMFTQSAFENHRLVGRWLGVERHNSTKSLPNLCT